MTKLIGTKPAWESTGVLAQNVWRPRAVTPADREQPPGGDGAGPTERWLGPDDPTTLPGQAGRPCSRPGDTIGDPESRDGRVASALA
jgi:hypothetical protein